MQTYSSPVLDHFYNPRNVGEVENYSGEGFSGGETERNYMRFTIRVENGRIREVKFQSYTCLVAVAACSILTVMAKGKTLAEADAITPQMIASELGGVPSERTNRCELAVEALRNAIADHHRTKPQKG